MRTIGPHRITNLNVIDPGVEALFDDGRKADVFYSDPPWGDGNVKFWATKAKKDTGQEFASIKYAEMLDRIYALIGNLVTGHVFMETGLRWLDANVERFKALGLQDIQTVRLLYKGGGKWLENVMIYGSVHGDGVDIAQFHHRSGQQLVSEAVALVARPGGIVFDPCCGMGYSAQAALNNGMEFRGNELNPVRLQKTIRRLER